MKYSLEEIKSSLANINKECMSVNEGLEKLGWFHKNFKSHEIVSDTLFKIYSWIEEVENDFKNTTCKQSTWGDSIEQRINSKFCSDFRELLDNFHYNDEVNINLIKEIYYFIGVEGVCYYKYGSQEIRNENLFSSCISYNNLKDFERLLENTSFICSEELIDVLEVDLKTYMNDYLPIEYNKEKNKLFAKLFLKVIDKEEFFVGVEKYIPHYEFSDDFKKEVNRFKVEQKLISINKNLTNK